MRGFERLAIRGQTVRHHTKLRAQYGRRAEDGGSLRGGIICAMKLLRVILFAACAAALLPAQEHWVATWTTAELMARAPGPAAVPANATPAQAINAAGFHNQTVRMIAREVASPEAGCGCGWRMRSAAAL